MRSSSDGATAREIMVSSSVENLPTRTQVKRKQRWRFWTGACFAVALVAIFGGPLLALISYVRGSQLHSYILLVPFVSAYLLYVRRDQLPKNHVTDISLAIVSFAIGLVVLVFTYWLDFTGRASAPGDRLTLVTISFLCCLAAGGFFFFGRTWMRAAAFPLGYLIFIIPMPDAMADALEQASSTASAEMANLLFNLSGMPFLREGPIFQLPNITLEVAQECSGIRSSLVLFITSILAANLFLKTTWRRLALVAIVIPLGILRNGFRILVIGFLCVHIGPQMIHSLIHRRGGPLFFVLSLVPLFLILWLLRKGDGKPRLGNRAT
jgi:exosortase C (VPDSG-CTERM-specific)